jgi:uncharacterized membrane protein
MENRAIETGKAISYGWQSVKKDFWYFVGIAFVYAVVSSLSSLGSDKKIDAWDILSPLLTAWITCGYTKMVLSYHSGKKLPFGELFTQFKYFWRVLGASILTSIIIVFGMILFFVPGVYFALKYQFVVQLIIDKDLSISEAFRQSAKMTDGLKMSLLGFDLTLLGVVILGAIVLGVGVLVALPVVWLASVFVYRKLSVPSPVATPAPAKA